MRTLDIPNEFTHRQFLGNSMRNWKIHLYVMGEWTINILMTNIINTKIRNIINIKYIAILEYVEYGNVNKSSHKWEDYWKFHDLLQDDHALKYIYILPMFSDNAMKANGYPMCSFSRPKQPGAAALGVGADGQQLCQAEEILPPGEVASDKKMCKSHDSPKMIYIHAGVLHI